jgi:hypothetical protein
MASNSIHLKMVGTFFLKFPGDDVIQCNAINKELKMKITNLREFLQCNRQKLGFIYYFEKPLHVNTLHYQFINWI